MRPTAYIETSVISYLTGRSSRDLVVAAHQQITREWWESEQVGHERLISELVVKEGMNGDPNAVARRLEAMRPLTVLQINNVVTAVAESFRQSLHLPPKADTDLLHIAFSVAYELDYLVTWNCAHIANVNTVRRLRDLCRQENWHMPLIVTPEWFLED